MSTSSFYHYPLFGEGISITLPSKLHDASDIRPVEDNQEIFTTPAGQPPLSIIIEVLTFVKPADTLYHETPDLPAHPPPTITKTSTDVSIPIRPGAQQATDFADAMALHTHVLDLVDGGDRVQFHEVVSAPDAPIIAAAAAGIRTGADGAEEEEDEPSTVRVVTGRAVVNGGAADETGIWTVLVRLVDMTTDVLVTVNVKAVDGVQEGYMREVMENIRDSFEVHDWWLFAGLGPF